MDIKKLAPWNWFKDEETSEERNVPVARSAQPGFYPLGQLHQEIDRVFDNIFRSLGFPTPGFSDGKMFDMSKSGQLRPNVDIAASDSEYSIAVEVAGVDEKDVNLELVNNSLIIKGEKKQEKERNEKGYYRVERSYGTFQRVLSLPEDADQENISAKFNNGVLTITLPRKAVPKSQGKFIEIKKAA